MKIGAPLLLHLIVPAALLHADPTAETKVLVANAIKAAGGEENLLRVFRMKERFNFGTTLIEPEKASTRVSILEAPRYWWLNGKDRDGEPAKFDVWAWTLVALTDEETVVETLPGVGENGTTTVAIRLTASIEPAMDLHFDPRTFRLVRLDWRNDIYRFTDWRVDNGIGYHAKTVMHRRKSDEPWFFHEILELERLSEAPAELPR